MSEHNPPVGRELGELISSIDVPAPPELHRHVQAMIEEAATRRGGPSGDPGRIRLGLGIAGMTATLLVLLLALGGSGSSKFAVNDAAALALARPTGPAPGESQSSPGALRESVDGIAFPYWEERFPWRASGSRSDSPDGRAVLTVF